MTHRWEGDEYRDEYDDFHGDELVRLVAKDVRTIKLLIMLYLIVTVAIAVGVLVVVQ